MPLVLCIRLTTCMTVSAQQYSAIDLYPLEDTPAGFVGLYQPMSAFGGQVAGRRLDIGPVFQTAVVWNRPNGAITLLRPMNSGFSSIDATDGTRQVGFAFADLGGNSRHAAMWSGSTSSVVDLHPTAFTDSEAFGIGGAQQVGFAGPSALPNIGTHAMLWSGTAASAVDLHPTGLAGFDRSVATGTDGMRQVGYANLAVGGASHALLWSGTAASALDLHPTNLPGIDFSAANAINGLQQVGYGGGSGTGGKDHAMLWTGTAASAVDLHPTSFAGFDSSTALGTNGLAQVGIIYNSAAVDAALWTGTAASAIDLAKLLPFTATRSLAYTIDPQGNAWGTATDSTGVIHSIEWSPVPEPASFLFACARFDCLCIPSFESNVCSVCRNFFYRNQRRDGGSSILCRCRPLRASYANGLRC